MKIFFKKLIDEIVWNWKLSIGRWICKRKGHTKGKFGRCNRCLILMDKSMYPPDNVNCRSSWKYINEN